MVDSADNSISVNVTQTTLGQNLDQFAFGNVFTQCLDFGNPLYDPNNFAGTDPNGGANAGTGDDGTGDGKYSWALNGQIRHILCNWIH